MDVFDPFLERLSYAGLQLLINPFYYIGLIFIVLHYRKQIQWERKLFHTRLHSLLGESWRALLSGWVGGILASLILLFVGVSLDPEVVILLWVISLLLIWLRVRYMCLAYAAGVLGVLHVVLTLLPEAVELQGIGPIFKIIVSADIPSLLVIVAVLHLLEGSLIGLQGARIASPLFFEGKRGRMIGGYQLQGFWAVPLFVLVPLQGGSTSGLPWSTLFGGDLANGWSLLAFPTMIGFTELTMSRLPQDKARWSCRMLVLYGLILFVLALAAHYWSPLILIAAILGIALHEALIKYSAWNESRRSPIYVHSQRGLTVLSVIPGGPAAELGIIAGEIVHKVNGCKVHNITELHAAMNVNSAFCKLEIVNLQGEIKFLQRAIYAGEHHQLGIILAPDQNTKYYVETKEMSLYTYLRSRLTGFHSNESGKPM
jgi:hypothetical protein